MAWKGGGGHALSEGISPTANVTARLVFELAAVVQHISHDATGTPEKNLITMGT